MYQSNAFIPQPGDAPPKAHLRDENAIPVIDLAPQLLTGSVIIQFSPEHYDHAVSWLDHLADEASSLAAKIRVRQAQTETLLAAVEASPGSQA